MIPVRKYVGQTGQKGQRQAEEHADAVAGEGTELWTDQLHDYFGTFWNLIGRQVSGRCANSPKMYGIWKRAGKVNPLTVRMAM